MEVECRYRQFGNTHTHTHNGFQFMVGSDPELFQAVGIKGTLINDLSEFSLPPT